MVEAQQLHQWKGSRNINALTVNDTKTKECDMLENPEYIVLID